MPKFCKFPVLSLKIVKKNLVQEASFRPKISYVSSIGVKKSVPKACSTSPICDPLGRTSLPKMKVEHPPGKITYTLVLILIFKCYFCWQCFSAHDLEEHDEHEEGTEHHEHSEPHSEHSEHSEEVERDVESLSSLIITNLLLGRCIGEPSQIDQAAFVDGVFETYGNGNHVIDEEGMYRPINIAVAFTQPFSSPMEYT